MQKADGGSRAGRRFGPMVAAVTAAAVTAAAAAVGGTVDGASPARAAMTPSVSAKEPEPRGKLEPQVLADIAAGGGTAAFWVMLEEKADLGGAERIQARDARGAYVYERLTATATRSQGPLRALLRSRKVEHRPFWAVNTIRVVGDAGLAQELASRADVRLVHAEKTYELPKPTPGAQVPRVNAVEWGIDRIKAPQVWAAGHTGAGIVVGVLDSGVQYNHPALVGKYRGNLGGGSFDHNYNWYDPSAVCTPITGAGVPCDNNGHGTHVAGTIVGDDGGANQIGVAPGAKFIAAKGCETNNCSTFALLASGQWMLAPTQTNGANPDPTRRPHIVNNSWGGGPDNDPWYQATVQAWVAAGIFPQFSNGNSGPGCGTAGNPGNSPLAYAAGAFDVNDAIASFSSRGASSFGGIVKPNISAPGVAIRSSVPTNGYSSISGTSMASPHVAGTVALLWGASLLLRGDVAETRDVLDGTAIDVSDLSCGGASGNNNVWGEGKLDAFAAFQQAPVGALGTLSGTVTSGGSPLEGATVKAAGPAVRTVTTNPSGGYSRPLTVGNYSVTASKYGYLSQTAAAVVSAGETTTVNFSLSVAPNHALSGVVRDSKGRRVGGAVLELLGTPLGEVTADAAGNYAFPLVAQGTYDLQVAPPSRCVEGVTESVALTATTTRNVTLPVRQDAFGHTCTTPTLSFEEAATVLPISGDEGMGTVTLPFSFPFYGGSYTTVHICTNGIVSFAPIPCNTSAGWTNRPIPDVQAPNAAIYPYWDDLWVDASSSIRGEAKGSAPTRRYVIEFRNVRYFNDTTRRVDFSAVLHENGDVLMQYRNIAADGREQGNSATIGIENAAGTDALQYSFNEPVLTSGLSLLFVPPGTGSPVPARPDPPGPGALPAPPGQHAPPRPDPPEPGAALAPPGPPAPPRPGTP